MTAPFVQSGADEALIRQGLAITESFEGWPAAAIDSLMPAARIGRYKRGDVVVDERVGEPQLVVLLAGHFLGIRVYPDGARVPIFIFNPGYVAGTQPPLETEKHVLYAYEARDDVVAIHLPFSTVIAVLDAHPLLWKSMARGAIKHHRAISTTLLDQQTGSTRQRLAATLGRLARTYGVDNETGSLRLRISQDDLAALLQVSRQSINREMRALEDLGLIGAEYGSVVIRQMLALRQMGGNAAGLDSPLSLTE